MQYNVAANQTAPFLLNNLSENAINFELKEQWLINSAMEEHTDGLLKYRHIITKPDIYFFGRSNVL